jgi:ABC-type nickel/cobalt efflux system permease component RcnA
MAMVVGVGLTLAAVAALTVISRDQLVAFVARHGGSLESASRMLEAATGFALVLAGVREIFGTG